MRLSQEQMQNQNREQLFEKLALLVLEKYSEKENRIGNEFMRIIERNVLLGVIDKRWKDHLYSMDYLKEHIHYRGYAQKEPLIEYKREGLELFENMLDSISEECAEYIFKAELVMRQQTIMPVPVTTSKSSFSFFDSQRQRPSADSGNYNTALLQSAPAASAGPPVLTKKKSIPKVKPNEPCPCGSGKKYKKCHGS